MADQLATPSDLASLMQSDLDLSTATLLVEIGTAIVQATVGQRLVQVVDDVQVVDVDEHDGGVWLNLPERPVTAVTAVLVGATVLSAPLDYTVQLSRARIWRSLGWRSTLINYYSQPSTVTVTNTHGWPAGHQRLQLARGAVLALCRGAYSNPSGATRITIDDYTEAYEAVTAQMDASRFLQQALQRQYGRPVGSALLIRGGS